MSEFECGSTWCCCGECVMDSELIYHKPIYADPLAALKWWAVVHEDAI